LSNRMSRVDSKSPSIAFNSDSESDSDDDEPVQAQILAPTPTIMERVKSANDELISLPSPPPSRASRIGFRDENDVIEFKDDSGSDKQSKTPLPVSPLVREQNLVQDNVEQEEYEDDFEKEEENVLESSNDDKKLGSTSENVPAASKADGATAGDEQPLEAETTNKGDFIEQAGSETIMVEQNGRISLQGSPEGDDESNAESFDQSQTQSRRSRTDVNPDYKSPYGLTDAQKKMGRQRQAAKLKRLKAEEDLKQTELEEKMEENESSYAAWIQRKKEEQKSARREHRKQKLNSSKMMADQPSAEERDEVWKEWLQNKNRQNRQQRIMQHQMEIEKMEGLYVRSRQENDKAFKKWKKKKAQEMQEAQIRHWEQVQISKAELRAIRQNQKQAAILNAARVASALEFL